MGFYEPVDIPDYDAITYLLIVKGIITEAEIDDAKIRIAEAKNTVLRTRVGEPLVINFIEGDVKEWKLYNQVLN